MNDALKQGAASLIMMGFLLILFGVVAIATPAVAGTAVVMVIGVVMLIAGLIQVISGFRGEGWRNRIAPLVLGLVTVFAALGVLGHPILGLSFLTLLLTAFFVIEGVWKIFISFSYRPASGWLAVLFSGVITLMLGVMIWRQWPVSGLWAVGVLVGCDLVGTGVSLVMVGWTLKKLQKMNAADPEETPSEAPA